MNINDNFTDFINFYRNNIISITSKVMMRTLGQIEGDIIDASICWAVTDNITELLADKGSNPLLMEVLDPIKTINFIRDQLTNNKLLIIWQDQLYNGQPIGSDHWFAIIGDNHNAHIIEHTPRVCNYSETMDVDQLVHHLYNILIGKEPDRFYQSKGQHLFKITSFKRKPLNSDTIRLFLTSNNEPY